MAVRGQVPMILGEGVTDSADRADAESEQVGIGMRRVALTIPVQGPFAARDAEWIVRAK